MNCQLLILACTILVTLGCSNAPTSTGLPQSAKAIENPSTAIKTACADAGFISFRSWNGEWIGTDCDTEIELHSDGKTVLREYGYAINTYEGTYSVSTDTEEKPSELTFELNGHQGDWPNLILYRDQSKLLLMPTTDSTEFVFGNRSGAMVPGGAGSFWPFRRIDNRPTK